MLIAGRAFIVLLALWSAHAEQVRRSSSEKSGVNAQQLAESRKPSVPIAGISVPDPQELSSMQVALREICVTEDRCTELIHDIIEARFNRVARGGAYDEYEYDLYSMLEFQICVDGFLRRVVITSDRDKTDAEINDGKIHIRVPPQHVRMARTLTHKAIPTIEIKRMRINSPPTFTILVEYNRVLFRRDPKTPDGAHCKDDPPLFAYLDLIVPITEWYPSEEVIEYTRARMESDPLFADTVSILIGQLTETEPTEERMIVDHLRGGTTEGQVLYQYLKNNGEFKHGFNQWKTERDAKRKHGGRRS